jgi:hypothetical protein
VEQNEEIAGAAVVRWADPVAEELEALERSVTDKEAEAAVLVIRLRDLRTLLATFLGEYNTRVGTLYAALDRIKLSIKEYLFRLDALKRKKKTLSLLKDVEEKVSHEFADERRTTEDTEQEASSSSERFRIQQEEEQRTALDGEGQEELKRLYRTLVQKYHPDLTRDPALREKHSQIMATVNEAYEKRDLEALRRYMHEAEKEEEIARETLQEKIARLRAYYAQLLSTITGLEWELQEAGQSDTYALREQVATAKEKEGRDLLQEMADKLQAEIREETKTLNNLLGRYKKRVSTMESV